MSMGNKIEDKILNSAAGTPLNRPAVNPKNGSNGNGERTVLILALAAVALVFGWPTIKSYIKEKNTADGSGYNDTVDKANSKGGSGYGGKADKANTGNADTGESSVNSDLSTCMGMDYDETLKKYGDSDGSVIFIENDNNKIEGIGIYGNGEYSICGLKCGDSQINLPNDFSLVNEIETFDNKKQLFYYSQQKKYLLTVISDNSTDKIKDIVLALDENGDYGLSDSYVSESESPSYKPYIAGVGDGVSYDDTYEGFGGSGYDGSYDDDDYDDEYYGDDDDSGYIIPYSDSVKLTKADLEGLSKEELRIARNEIYARHGRKFLDAGLQEYFDSQDWYYGTIEPEDFVDSEELSALERRNAKFIKKYE